MTAATLTLTDFLLARIAEDESCPRCRHRIREHYGRWCRAPRGAVNSAGQELICCCEAVDREADARVLAECSVKRWIVEECRMLIHSFGDWDATPGAPASWPDVSRRERSQAHGRLRALASIYADHPDFRDEWRP